MGSKAKITPVREAIRRNKDEDIAKTRWLYLQKEMVIMTREGY
tara:strand:- start:473 stop:601 length:129 start_codon:yes stop_codon:yes gene_type:complete